MDSVEKAKSPAASWWHNKVAGHLSQCSTSSQDRSLKLLENAADTGDVILLGQDGVEVPAHSLYLAESPYFKARLSKTWECSTSFNFSNKLKLNLPLEASKEGLEVLLGYLYLGNRCFLRMGPLDSTLMQEVLTLGEACDLPELCTFLIHLVKIDEGNVQSWLAWLDAERISNPTPIIKQCAIVVKTSLQSLAPQTVSMPAKDLLAVWELIARLGSGAARTRGSSINFGEAVHGHTQVKIVTELDIQEHIGNSGFYDLVDWENIATSYLEPDTTIAGLKAVIAVQLGIPTHLQRFWLFRTRQNQTIRVNRVISPRADALRVTGFQGDTAASLPLFLEAPVLKKDGLQSASSSPLALPELENDSILLFLKLYDPAKETLRYIGSMFVQQASRPADYLQQMKELAGLRQEKAIQIFEEIRFKPSLMCDAVDQRVTFAASQLETGDILVIQEETYRFPDAPSFLESLVKPT